MQDILKAYQNTAAGDITRYEGQVAKFMGDGILAYFGWPRAHEDEAERAARAALAVVDSIGKLKNPEGKPLACRIGIATGLVVVGELVGEGAAREETVVGETPNLAARLQQRAPPGAVVVSEATRRLLEGLFDFQVLDVQVLKGIPGSVQVFQLLRPTAVESRFEARRAKGVLPLIGREQELALLLDRWEQARTSEGQVVLLLGEAGIGKSRIALAVRKRVRQEPSTILRYHGSPYYTQTALKPVIEQLARAAGFERDDSHALRLDKLEALLAHAGQDPKTSTPVLAALLGLPGDGRYLPLDMTPPVLRARTFELLLAQLVGLARQQPVLVMLEDAHWLDPTTHELFDRLVDRVQTLPILLVVTARSEFTSHWPSYAHVTVISLNRLGMRQAEAIIARICGGKPLPREVLDQILARTDGVPLFIEEFTRAVLDLGLLRQTAERYVLDGPLPLMAVPATLHDSLMARLDRLDLAKELAQTAACIGRAFTADLIAAASGLDPEAVQQSLGRLVEAELIHPRAATGLRAMPSSIVSFASWRTTAS